MSSPLTDKVDEPIPITSSSAAYPRAFSPHGVHCMCELYDVRAELLRDESRIMELLRVSIMNAGFTILNEVSHRFPTPGGGFTGVLLLAESHASVHTYPEHRYAALDIFTCGSHNPTPIMEELCRQLSCETYTLRSVERGGEHESLESRCR